MPLLPLSLACGPYDRIEPLTKKAIVAEGIDLSFTPFDDPRMLFDRLMATDEFDVAEMSSTEYIAMTSLGSSPFVAIPVFPSKMFRHGFIVVNRNAGIKKPKDLEGQRIGVPLHTMSAALWCRGILRDEYKVDLSNVTWVQGAIDSPGAHGSPSPPPLLKPARIEINRTGRSLSELLAEGSIVGTIGALLPKGFGANLDLVRLFPDYREIEKAYFAKTKIHPIMHLIVIRKQVYERNPWIAKSLFDAFERAKRAVWERLHSTASQKYMFAWQYADIEESDQVFDGEPWSYGLDKNRAALTKALDYMVHDDMISRRPTLSELFIDVDR
jgi:4,5-dihydroxyphthalate decarboxylase